MNTIHKILLTILALAIGGGAVILAKGNLKREAGSMFCSDGQLSATRPIQGHYSYCLKSESSNQVFVNTASDYVFSIVDNAGNTVKDFAVTHTKPMHVIVVRKDLGHFQHLHPEFNRDSGTFTVSGLIFPTDGQYRIFADFAPEGGMKDTMGMPLALTAFADVHVGSSFAPQSIGSEEASKTFEGVRVNLSTSPSSLSSNEEAMLTFALTQNGKAVTDLEEYLGALGHSVILREGTLDFIHAHPMESSGQNGKVEFMVTFPESGKYKVFTQFQRSGKVFTTDFVVSVAQGGGMPGMPGMHHSMH